MDARELLIALREAQVPSRALDVELAKFFGYVQTVDRRWVSSNGEILSKLPAFTVNVDESLRLSASAEGGVSWELGKGSAQLGEGRIYQASNPAIALCIAAVLQRAQDDHKKIVQPR